MFESLSSIWTLLATILAVSFYFYLKHVYSYWTRLGVGGPPPTWIIGNAYQRLAGDVHQIECDWVSKHGKVYGAYAFTIPSITVADVELVKQVLIRDFRHFVNHFEIKAYHELWNKNIFFSSDDTWKRLRTITSPSFSSAKLRSMMSIMQRNVDKLDEHLEKLVDSSGGEKDNRETYKPNFLSIGVMDTKTTMAGYTIDVIASSAFATETNANDADSGAANPFVINARALYDVNPLRLVASVMLPTFMLRLLGIETFFPPKPFNFFVDLAKHIVGERGRSKSGKRNDLVQLLMDACVDEQELRNMNYDNMTAKEEQVDATTKDDDIPIKDALELSNQRKLTESEVIANCIFFFIAGFETTSATIAHCIFELAQNRDIQDRLHRELCQAIDRFDDSVKRNSDEYFSTVLNGIQYLEAVVKETLRRYPPVLHINRVCNKEGYMLGRIPLFKGEVVVIPTSAIHLNPEYYPEPKRFNPDRFLPENKHLLVPYTFLPFSLGPRNCIAMQFAYQEIKLLLAQIVLKYRLDTTMDTPRELTFKHSSGLLIADPFPICVAKRL